MQRARLSHIVKDAAGNVVRNASVTVRQTGTTTAITDTMYLADTGATTTPNPLISNAQGEILAYFQLPGTHVPGAIDLFVEDNANTAYYPATPTELLDFTAFTETSIVEPPTSGIALTVNLYVHPSGNNSNDGLTWQTAKKDAVSAYTALPSAGGTINLYTGSMWDAADSDRGCWIVGPNDALYASPPTNWVQQKGMVNFVGVVQQLKGITGGIAQLDWGSGTDINKPAIHLTGIDSGMRFSNISCGFPARNLVLGISTDFANRSVNTSNFVFSNCNFEVNQGTLHGPVIDVGYCFWQWFKHCSIGSNFATYSLISAAITSGTTARFVTSVSHRIRVGEVIRVAGVTPSGYNGDWTVTSVDATAFGADIGTSPGGATVLGTALPFHSEQRASINLRSSSANAGLLYVEDCVFSMGNIRQEVSGATGSGNIIVRDTSWEGDFSSTIPEPVYLKGVTKDFLGLVMDTVGVSDTGASQSPYIARLEYASSEFAKPGHLVIHNCQPPKVYTKGGVHLGGASYVQPEQAGFGWPNKVIGDSDAMRGNFAPTLARWANLVSTDLTTWTGTGTPTLTTGVAAPDGTTNALRVTSDGTGIDSARGATTSQVYTAGDYVFFGAWLRPDDGQWSGYTGATDLLEYSAAGVTFSKLTGRRMFVEGAGKEWTWVVGLHKVTTGATTTGTFDIYSTGVLSTEIFAPFVYRAPVTAVLSDDEAFRILNILAPVSSNTVAGDIGILAGHGLSLNGVRILSGAGTPEAAITAPMGSAYLRTDGAADTTLYLKTSGAGNTGWTAADI